MSVVKEGPGIKARANILDSEALEAQLSILQLFLPIAGWLVGRQDGESYTLLATRGVFGDFSPQALDSLLEKEWCECAQVAGFQYRCATDTEHIFLPRRIPADPRKGYLIRARLTEPGGDCIGYVIGFAYEPMLAQLRSEELRGGKEGVSQRK